ncbi:MAG: amidophosphoribosyltransferase [Gammaproteobacteria bacterium]|nr:amidophosphoribosyltransferase [Gammaproteobacteria bacterium]MBI5614844.1 amidophosphoribosyltransferase [Gammaproteobacteria bacterium]
MCGIIGIVAKTAVNQALYDGLTVLQHRGQDAAGIATYEDGRLYLRKSDGLVRDVFHTRHMINLKGRMGIGHVRYPTAGMSSTAEAQPFYVNSPYGITLAHNGNLTNFDELKRELFQDGLRHINTDSDSEVLLNVFAHELASFGKVRIDADDVFRAVARLHRRCRGGYAAVSMITGVGILGFRDPYGIRPIVFGRRDTELGPEYIIASESVAIDVLGFELVRDLEPGEVVFISKDGDIQTRQCADEPRYSPCIFEHVYLARPDSILDGISVHKARMRMGESLAKKVMREWPDNDIDVVIPIPDTARTAALELAHALNVPYREGFIKNRYIPRTFIMPGQAMRRKSVRQKLNAIDLEFRGKNVLLVDDSIVRGTTSTQIIQMARDSGARRVYFASAAPPVRYPNVYGIDMPTTEELVANQRSIEEVCQLLGADRLIYQDLEDLIEAARRGNPRLADFDVSCFTGQYVTGDVSLGYLNQVQAQRSDEAKARRAETSNALQDLHVSADA